MSLYSDYTMAALTKLGYAVKATAASMGRGEPAPNALAQIRRVRKAARRLESELLTDYRLELLPKIVSGAFKVCLAASVGFVVASILIR